MISLNSLVATAMRVGLTFGIAGAFYLQPYRPMMFVGKSMEPTYRNNSIMLTEPVQQNTLKHGDVVVINMDSGPIVKRIAFVPGDKIIQVYTDGHWVDLVYVQPTSKAHLVHLQWREYVVPKRMVYVLGDNQEVSYDSKEFGCVSTSRISRMLVDQRPFDTFCQAKRPRIKSDYRFKS